MAYNQRMNAVFLAASHGAQLLGKGEVGSSILPGSTIFQRLYLNSRNLLHGANAPEPRTLICGAGP